MRFLHSDFPYQQHQKIFLTSPGNLGDLAYRPDARVQVKGGDIYLEDIDTGMILKSPDGSCWWLTVTDAGAPSFEKLLDCPGVTSSKNDDQ